MPFWRTYYHLVWSTKNREPSIIPEIEGRLLTYIQRKAAEMEVIVYAANTWYDHMHLVLAIPPKHAVAVVVKELKGASAHYINHEVGMDHPFYWQRGYGVLSLGKHQLSVAEEYVRNQKQHHQGQATNAWLERAEDSDEGLVDAQTSADGARTVREALPAYGGEEPF